MSTDLRSLFDAIQRGDTHEITSHLFPRPSADTANKPLSHGQKDVPTASLGSVEAGLPYPVTCRARYYDAASRILEEEGQLLTHDNTNELGALIEQWINDARDNWEPRS